MTVQAISHWIAEAQGAAAGSATIPELFDGDAGDNMYALVWSGRARVTEALDRADTAAAARIAEETLSHVLAVFGLEDEFIFHWPALVQAALANGDPGLADRLMEPVTTTRAVLAPYLDAQRLCLRGLIGAARGDDPAAVETDLRAGVAGLASFGAIGDAARAEEELARWLISQDRAAEAEPLLAHVRATYEQIGAFGWLAQVDSKVPTSS
jgi:hypothetical protein